MEIKTAGGKRHGYSVVALARPLRSRTVRLSKKKSSMARLLPS